MKSKIKVTHIQQLHPTKEYDPEDIKALSRDERELWDKTIISQFLVAKRIQEKVAEDPNIIVLAEGLMEDIVLLPEGTEGHREQQFHIQGINKAFSKGLNISFSKLNQPQKDLLSYIRGVFALFGLGVIKAIYKTIPLEQREEKLKIDKFFNAHTWEQKEKLLPVFKPIIEGWAIECVKEAARHTGSTNVLLIFGSSHDFTRIKDSEIDFQEPLAATPEMLSRYEEPIKNGLPRSGCGIAGFLRLMVLGQREQEKGKSDASINEKLKKDYPRELINQAFQEFKK